MQIITDILQGLHFNQTAFISLLVLFVVFHFSMRALVYDRLIEVKNQREGRIEGRLAQARSFAEKAQQAKSEYEVKMRDLRNELAGKLRESTAAAEAEAAKILADARTEADAILTQAEQQLQEEKKQLESQMEQKVASLSKSITSKVVENSFSSSVGARLLAKIGG